YAFQTFVMQTGQNQTYGLGAVLSPPAGQVVAVVQQHDIPAAYMRQNALGDGLRPGQPGIAAMKRPRDQPCVALPRDASQFAAFQAYRWAVLDWSVFTA